MSVKKVTGEKPMTVLFSQDRTNLTSRGFWLKGPVTIIGTGLGENDVITFNVVYLKGAQMPADTCACIPVTFNKPSVIGEQQLMCPECVDEVGFVPVRLTTNNPVVVLDSPLGQIIQAHYDGAGRENAHVWVVESGSTESLPMGLKGCPTECCEDIVWYDTGLIRCDVANETVEKQQISNCGRLQWVDAGPMTWDDTGKVRCVIDTDILEKQQQNNCGDIRWVEAGPLQWTDTGEIRCDDENDSYEILQRNNCGDLRWVDGGALEWAPTGEFRCNVESDTRDVQERNNCGFTRWVPSSIPLTWTDTGAYVCEPANGIQRKEQRNECGDLRLVEEPLVWTPTGEFRCISQNEEAEETTVCGQTRWVATGNKCDYVASYPIPGTCGWAYQAGDNIDPAATVELEDCDGAGLSLWLYPAPNTLPLATVPVLDCLGANCPSGSTPLGYARNAGPEGVGRCDLASKVEITRQEPTVVQIYRTERHLNYVWSDGYETQKYDPQYCATLPVGDGFGYRNGDLKDPEATVMMTDNNGNVFYAYPTPRPGASIPYNGAYVRNVSHLYRKTSDCDAYNLIDAFGDPV